MFGTIRKHQQWLWIVIIAGVIISFVAYFSPNQPALRGLAGGGGEFGSFNGKPLTREMLMSFGRQAQLAGRLRFGDAADSAQARQMGFDLNQQRLELLFVDYKLKEFGITASDDAVASWIRDNLRDPKTGTVDYQAFVDRVLTANRFSEAEFQDFVRRQIGLTHLRDVISVAGQLVSPEEAKTEFRRMNEQSIVSVAMFSPTNYSAQVAVGPMELRQFFTNQLANYRIPEQTVVSYLRWDAAKFTPEVEADIAKRPDMTNQFLALYRQRGADFFRDKNGTVLSQDAAIGEIRRNVVESESLSRAGAAATEFANALYAMEPLKAENLAALAQKQGLAVRETQPFSESRLPVGLEDAGELVRASVRLTAAQPFTRPVRTDKSVFLAALIRRIPSQVPPFEQVEAQVTVDYRRAKATELARTAGQNFAAAAQTAVASGKSFAAAAAEAKVKAQDLPPFSAITTSLPAGAPAVSVPFLQRVVSSLKPGAVGPFMPYLDGGLVVFLKEQKAADESLVKAGLNSFLEEQRRQRQEEAFQEWFGHEFQKSGLAALLKKSDGAN